MTDTHIIDRLLTAIGAPIDAPSVKKLIEDFELVPVVDEGYTFFESDAGLVVSYEDERIKEAVIMRSFEGEIASGVTMMSDRDQVRAAFGPPDKTKEPDTIDWMRSKLERAGWDQHQRDERLVFWQYYEQGGIRVVTIK